MSHTQQLDLPLAIARIEENWGLHFTTAVLRGPTRESIQRAVEQYLRDFSPMGYSTRVIEEPKEQEDGTWTMKLSRYTTCE